MPERLFLGVESLGAGDGGIARVARLMARVVGEEVAAGRLAARGVALRAADGDVAHAASIQSAGGSRVRYLLRTYRAALDCSHFLYDSLGMVRAHCRLPFFRRPCLAWMHGIEIWEGARSVRVRWARRAELLLTNSAYTRERADRLHGGLNRARVCWLGTESDEPPALRGPGRGAPSVLVLGRLHRERDKGHGALISCWPKVVSAVPDARLLVVGTGPDLDSFRRQALESPCAGQIDFRGFVPDEKMDEVWAEAAVFAMPSRGEGFGLVYIEAMRQGLPVIGSVHDAAPEINPDGETGFNVSLDRPDELPDRLIHLLRNPDRAAALGANGRERWEQHFRYSAFKARFLPLLKEFRESLP